MASHDARKSGLGLRARFLVAAAALVLTAVLSSVWTLGALSRLGTAVSDTVKENDDATRATAQVASALEREDDALLLVISGDDGAAAKLTEERRHVDEAASTLDEVLNAPFEQELVDGLKGALANYRASADLVTREEPRSLARYHKDVNPLLRRAVAFTGRLRDRHFESTQHVATQAREEVGRARSVVLGITLAALVVSVLLALHLARLVVVPVLEMTKGANAMAKDDFDTRLAVRSHDELGDLALAFNDMAEHLAEFRRVNIGETLRAKATLEATLEALPDAVILLDAGGRTLSVNRRARDVLRADDVKADVSSLHLGGTSVAELAKGASGVAMDFARALRVDLHGSTRRFVSRVLPVTEDEHAGKVLVLYDVTEFARLDEMRAELIAVASHELRTPLTTLRMTLLMLREGSETLSSRQRELVDTCWSGVQQLSDTIDEFLDLTRIEAGQLRLAVEPIAVESFLSAASERSRLGAAQRRVAIEIGCAPDLVLRGDRARLGVVLDNLLSNALKYAPEGSRVELGARGVGATVELSVTDHGPGIAHEFRERVFDKFFRVEHEVGSDRGVRGVGIGLYLCRQIVALHGGTIRCTEADGGGTRMLIEFPVQAQTELGSAQGELA